MDNGVAHDLQQPYFNRALLTRSQLRWVYYFSLGTFWFLRRSAFARLFVTNSALTVDGPGGVVEIQFHQLAGLKYFGLPYVGGWFVLTLQNGRKFYLTSLIERADYVLDAIAIAQPTLVPSEKLETFRRNAIVADHFYARMENSFTNWRMLFVMQIVLPLALTAAVSVVLKAREPADVFLIFASFGILNGIVSLNVWGWAEFFEMMRKNAELIANPLNPLRDLKREQRVKYLTRLIHAAVATTLAFMMWV